VPAGDPGEMRVLAIDTALEACAAAVVDTDRGVTLAQESQAMARGHAEALMPLLARVMDAAAIDFPSIDRIAVTVGPGSFTGLRVGISAARGIALVSGKPAVGISSPAALAAPHMANGGQRAIVAVVDARHEQVYAQIFGAEGRSVAALRLAPTSEVVQSIPAGPALIVGPGAELVAGLWPPTRPRPLVDARKAPDITWVARLGSAADVGRAVPKPLYLRPPDARPQHGARVARR
jgi:tRNA threonylcarbamoyladenosine biosynthesis protein TsaB